MVYHMNERHTTLRAILRHWLMLALAFNLVVASVNLFHHEDLPGHLARHPDFVILFGLLLNGFFALAMLPELYLYILRKRTFGRYRHVYRVAMFLVITLFFCYSLNGFYARHAVPHTPGGPSLLYKP